MGPRGHPPDLYSRLGGHRGAPRHTPFRAVAPPRPPPHPAVPPNPPVGRDASLVEARADGNRRIYRARPEGLEPLYGFVRALWPARLDALRGVVESDLGRRADQP